MPRINRRAVAKAVLCGLFPSLLFAWTLRTDARDSTQSGNGTAALVQGAPRRSAEKPPLPEADVVARTYAKHILGTEGMEPTVTSMWCSNEHLLYFEVRNGYPGYLRAARLNIRTGLRTPLPALSQVLTQTRGRETQWFNWAIELRLSPDGKWLLWPGTLPDSGEPCWVAAAVDGGDRIIWPRTQAGPFLYHHFWLADSRGWAYESAGKGAVYSLNDAPNVRNFEHPLPMNAARGGSYIQHWGLPSGHILATEALVYVTRGNVSSPDWFRGIRFFDFPPEGEHTLTALRPAPERAEPEDKDVTMTHITYPPGHGYWDCAVSPRGDRIAWNMAVLSGSGEGVSFNRLSLWVSRTDGSGMRPILPPGIDAPRELFIYLAWTPDGSRLSFWHAARLWTLPVEPGGSRSRPAVP